MITLFLTFLFIVLTFKIGFGLIKFAGHLVFGIIGFAGFLIGAVVLSIVSGVAFLAIPVLFVIAAVAVAKYVYNKVSAD